MAVSGYATPEGTLAYTQRFEAGIQAALGHFRKTFDGLVLSSLGMGTYLGDLDQTTDQLVTQATIASVSQGAINVLDTAINYRYQLGERALKDAMTQLFADGYERNQLFISSKNGYLSPDAAISENFRTFIMQQYIEPGVIQPDDIVDGMHCMSPGYLDDQLNRSLNNLGLETLDLMYLHNAAESQIPAVGPTEFMTRLRKAFEFYEQARSQNRIRTYGLATWDCFRVMPEQAPTYLNLETVVKFAEAVGGPNHGFKYIQLPFNLVFTEAAVLKNQTVNGQPVSTLEAAHQLGIGVFTSIPLFQGQLLQGLALPQFDGLTTPAQQCLQFVRSYPGVLAPLVGHKQPEHVHENLLVTHVEPLTPQQFEASCEAFARAQTEGMPI